MTAYFHLHLQCLCIELNHALILILIYLCIRHLADSAIFQSWYIVADFTFQVFVTVPPAMLPSLRLFCSFTPLQNGSYGDTAKYLSVWLGLPSVIFAFRRKGGIMTSHPRCFFNKAEATFFGIYLFHRAFSVHFLLMEGLN